MQIKVISKGEGSAFCNRPMFFLGEISPNFDLKNMISTYTKGFSMKKMAQILHIWKKKEIFFFPDRQIFMISSGR
jgi:hypothetical protein